MSESVDQTQIEALVNSLPQLQQMLGVLMEALGAEIRMELREVDDYTIDYVIEMKFSTPDVVKKILEASQR
jgi:hypothetical protein